MLYLSVDFGTSAVKMSIVDEALQTLGWASEAYRYLLLPGEKAELREADLLRAFYGAAAKLDPALRERVELLCYDTFSPSPVFLDEEGGLVYPNIITHMDRRSREQISYIDEVVGKDAYMRIAGIYPFAGGCSAMTLIWFEQNAPEVLKRTCRIGHLPTYIHKKLTGKWMVDLVNASMLGLYETTTQGSWSKTLLASFGLKEEWFGQIVDPGTLWGTLLPAIARKLGVPCGIPVAAGTNDIAAAQLGAGNNAPGCMMNAAGSSEMISILTDRPVTDPAYYLRNAATPGLWQIYVTTCGGFGVDWFYEQFCSEMSKPEFYEYLSEAVADNLVDNPVTFAPYLTGDRQSLERKTASWTGLTLASTRAQMLSAMLGSMQGVLLDAIQRAQKVVRLSDVIKVSGGMVTPSYLRLKGKLLPGFRMEVVEDCPILGNVILARSHRQ